MMRTRLDTLARPLCSLLTAAFLLLLGAPVFAAESAELPWRDAGLTERQAAAHLLDRFAYGPRPGEVDRVVAQGLEAWLEGQIAGALPEPALAPRLEELDSLTMAQGEILERYPNPGVVLRQRQRAGKLDVDEGAAQEAMAEGDRSMLRREYRKAMNEEGFRPQRELIADLYRQKLYRAVYGENQLHEVLTDFWFNHFNVSLADNEVRSFVTTYERDAIRPHVVGNFRTLLEATAKHPAMLLYLDNARSVADPGAPTTFDAERYLRQRRGGRGGFARRGGRGAFRGGGASARSPRRSSRGAGADSALAERRPQGLNENYARELLELHTLGVDGGYDQDDVIEVARAFTGWTLLPPGRMSDERTRQRLSRARRLPADAGFVFEGDFLFRADAHDAGSKRVLGRELPAGRGIEDGLEVLDLLAAHPSTARHIATKVAIRFVADEPPAELVDDLAASFRSSDGDLAEVIRRLAHHPAFWQAEVRQSKIKSPFEVAASALRALDAEVEEGRGVLQWVVESGHPVYSYQAPTGFPDSAESWVNTGSLLARMSFGLELAAGRVPGVTFDLEALLDGREPASAEAALDAFLPVLMPERDPAPIRDHLLPVVRDPSFAERVAAAAEEADGETGAMDDLLPWDESRRRRARGGEPFSARSFVEAPPSATAYVVGLILGSPEFQRR